VGKEHWWNGTNTGRNLLHCSFVQHKAYMKWLEKESGFVLGKKVEHSQKIKVVLIDM